MTATILKATDETMEVLDRTISDTPESAKRAGDREARKFSAMGHACECIGVVEAEVEMLSQSGPEISVPTDTMGMRYNFNRSNGTHVRRVYHPVISPPIPAGE